MKEKLFKDLFKGIYNGQIVFGFEDVDIYIESFNMNESIIVCNSLTIEDVDTHITALLDLRNALKVDTINFNYESLKKEELVTICITKIHEREDIKKFFNEIIEIS